MMANKAWDVAAVSDLPAGQMKEVQAGEKKILLANVNGTVHAVDAACPHYGVSLVEGLLSGDRVICPWHKSCFRVTDGALLEPPALDSLQSYRVEVRSGRVHVELPEKEDTFVIVGAGAAGMSAAETLRKEGFSGRLIMISHEDELPYDRTKLSKEFLSGNGGTEILPLRPAEFFHAQSIERVRGRVVAVEETEVLLSDGTRIAFDRLLLSPGSLPQSVDIPGVDLGNVFTLRSQKDAEQILQSSPPGTRIAIIGGSFIALEAASCFALRKLPVTVILPEDVPFAKQLGPEVGEVLKRWHESHGVEFRTKAKVAKLDGTGVVKTVVLEGGQTLAADLVVVGVGVRPATEFAPQLATNQDGGIPVDSYLCAKEKIYSAGDAAAYPERIEHWRVAEQQGRVAARNMLGRQQPFESVPYFWTNHFGTRFEYLGHAKEWDEVIFRPDPEAPGFLAYYVKDGEVAAAAACRHDLEIAALHELLQDGRKLNVDDLRLGPTELFAKSAKQ